MSEQTKIEWCDSTFSPWIGCTKVSPACDHCYAAEQMDKRLGKARWGAGQARVRTSAANWKLPLRWNDAPFFSCECGYRGTMHEMTTNAVHGCDLRFTRVRRRVFCASLADVFDNEVDVTWLVDLLDLIRNTPNLDWLLLTKRIGRVSDALKNVRAHLDYETPVAYPLSVRRWVHNWIHGDAPKNVWLGATICNQAESDRDIPKLLSVPAAKRFVSIEPMLSAIDLRFPTKLWGGDRCDHCCNGDRCDDSSHYDRPRCPYCRGTGRQKVLDWVIAGGESGRLARPSHPDWFRSLRDQCAAAGVPFLLKQWGEYASVSDVEGAGAHFTFDDGATVRRIGKKAAGRTLDGIEHNAFPSGAP